MKEKKNPSLPHLSSGKPSGAPSTRVKIRKYNYATVRTMYTAAYSDGEGRDFDWKWIERERERNGKIIASFAPHTVLFSVSRTVLYYYIGTPDQMRCANTVVGMPRACVFARVEE